MVLVSARDPGLRAHLAAVLSGYGVELSGESPAAVLSLLDRHPSFRLLIVVESDGDLGALELLTGAKQQRSDIAVILLSRVPTIAHATEAIRRGAEDFIPIPFSADQLRKEVDRVLEAADLRERVARLQDLADGWSLEAVVGASPRMRPAFEIARAAARSDRAVLITGETGTGKELFARAIHAGGRRAHKAFVALNCAAIPKDLVESELFGHRRGAFSGADRDYAGLFVAADGGALLLDEIGELPAEAQAKLLRVLQDGEVRPVGGLESRRTDVRIFAATNRKLSDLRGGALRQDLYFRLSVLVLDLPPLRVRFEDIPALVARFLAKIRVRGASGPSGIEAEALDLLCRYHFPGNVRELENLIEGVSVTMPQDQSVIRAGDLRGWFRRRGIVLGTAPDPGLPSLNLKELEAWAIPEALRRSHGNKSEAAHLLGISRDTLYRKLGGDH